MHFPLRRLVAAMITVAGLGAAMNRSLAQPVPWVALKQAGPEETFYWNDAENWLSGQVPDSDVIGSFADIVLGGPPNPLIWGDRGPDDLLTPEEVTEWLERAPGKTVVIYTKPDGLGNTFGSITLEAFPVNTIDDTELEFRIVDDLDAITMNVGQRTVVKHHEGTVTSSITIEGGEATARYELGGTGVVDHDRWYHDSGAFNIGANGVLAVSGGRIEASLSELNVKGTADGDGLYQQSGGDATFVLANVGYGGSAAVEVSGGTLTFSPMSGGREVYFGYLSLWTPETVLAEAETRLSISGGRVEIGPQDADTTQLVMGENYASRLELSGTGALEVHGDIFLGGKSDGYLQIDGGTIDALRLWVGNAAEVGAADDSYHGESIAVQNGGTVTLHYDLGSDQYGLRIGAPNAKEHSYTLNGGALNTDVTLVGDHAAFVQNGGVHTTEFLKLQSDVALAPYTLNHGALVVGDHASIHRNAVFTINDGTAEFAELAVTENGVFNYAGGTVSATSLDLRGEAAQLNHGAGLTLRVSGGADMADGFVYTVPTGGELEIGGTTEVFHDSRIEVPTGVLSLGAASFYGTSRLIQSGGNVVMTGDTRLEESARWEQSAGTTLHTALLEVGTVSDTLGAAALAQTGGVFSGTDFKVNYGGKLQLDGGTTTFGQDGSVAGLLNIGADGGLTARDLTLRIGGALTQAGDLTVRTLSVIGDAEAYLDGGTTTIGSGGLQVIHAGDAGTVRVDGAAVTTARADIGAGSVVRVYSGSLVVTGATQVLEDGALHNQGGSLSMDTLTIASGGVARFSGGDSTVTGLLDVTDRLYVEGGNLTAGSANLREGSVTSLTGNSFTVTGATQLDGALVIDGGSADFGTATVQTGGTLMVSGGEVTVDGDTRVETGGAWEISAGEVEVMGETVVDGSLTLSGGTLRSDGFVFAPGTFTWTGGTLDFAGNDLEVSTTSTWGPVLGIGAGQTLRVGGLIDVLPGGNLTLAGGVIETGDLHVVQNATNDFAISAGGQLTVAGDLNYDGVRVVTPGAKFLQVGGASTVAVGGNFNVGTWSRVSQFGGSQIEVGGTLRLGSDEWHETEYLLSGANTVLQTGSTIVGAGGKGTFTHFGDGGLRHIVSGDLVVGQGVTGNGTYTLRAGAQLDAGRLLIGADGATGTFTNTEATLNVTGTVENRGTFTQTGGLNRRGVTHAALFDNRGTVTLSETTLDAVVNNTGTMRLEGYVAWKDGVTHTNSGTLTIDRGSSDFFYLGAGSTLMNQLGGVIEGNGGIGNGTGLRSAIIDHGTLAPGIGAGSIAQLTIYGNYEQMSDAVIALEVAGLNASQYDRLAVSINGSADFGGALQIDFINGYTPSVGDTYNFISGANTRYAFTDVEVRGLGADLSWRAVESGGAFGITIVQAATSAVPEASTYTLWVGALTLTWAWGRRRRNRST